MVSNPKVTSSIVEIAVPKCNGFRIVTDYRFVYQLMQQAATPMRQQEELEESEMLIGWAAASCTVGMIEGRWNISSHESV